MSIHDAGPGTPSVSARELRSASPTAGRSVANPRRTTLAKPVVTAGPRSEPRTT